jgi:Ras-related protein Rab-6A
MQPLPSSDAADHGPTMTKPAAAVPHADGEAAPLVASSSGAAGGATSLDDTTTGGAGHNNGSFQASSSAASLPTAGFAAGAALSGYKLKVIFVGDQAVGKTSIISRFMYDAFERHYQATLGIDFLTKAVVVDGRSVRLQLWDTAGQERFRSLIPSYIRNSAAAIVVFDVTSRESFTNVARWVDDVRAERGDAITLLLVGNKSDLGEVRVVSAEEAAARAADLGAAYAEVSAKTGANVKALFRRVAAMTPPPPEAMAAAAGGAVEGGAGFLGAGGAGTGAAGMRRLDPLLVTPSRTQAALAARANGGNTATGTAAGAGSYCGSC